MVGYWRQPELTAKCTHHRPGPDGNLERWHRTGDLVQQQPDGQFRLIGRQDRMVKTRGNRVELDEVETALVSHHAVEQAVVYAVPDDEGSVQIEAVVTLYDGAIEPPDAPDLVAHAAKRLPKYALPRVVKIVDSVPRTSTGKADRVALVAVAQNGSIDARLTPHGRPS
jgi:acyl-CoA synthetase (AMP-forming)/AMP-acid ligase II